MAASVDSPSVGVVSQLWTAAAPNTTTQDADRRGTAQRQREGHASVVTASTGTRAGHLADPGHQPRCPDLHLAGQRQRGRQHEVHRGRDVACGPWRDGTDRCRCPGSLSRVRRREPLPGAMRRAVGPASMLGLHPPPTEVTMSRITSRVLYAALLGQLVAQLGWIDPLFIPLVLAGPPLTGAILASRRVGYTWVAALWASTGIGMAWSDWVVNRSDVGCSTSRWPSSCRCWRASAGEPSGWRSSAARPRSSVSGTLLETCRRPRRPGMPEAQAAAHLASLGGEEAVTAVRSGRRWVDDDEVARVHAHDAGEGHRARGQRGSSTVLRPCFRSTSRPRSGTRRKALQSNCEVPSMTHVVGIPAYSTVSAGS